MTMVGGGDDMTAMLLQFLQNKKAVNREKARTFLELLQPGQTLGEGGAKAFKTATGQGADPSTVLVRKPFEQEFDEQLIKSWANLPQDQRVAALENWLINKSTGESGVQTRASVKSRRKETEAATAARATVSEAAEGAVSGVKPKTEADTRRAEMGERHVFGQTGAETTADVAEAKGRAAVAPAETTARIAEAGARVTEADVKGKVNKFVSNFLDDPKNSAWGKALIKRGKDPVAVTEAFAMGHGGVLTGFMNMDLQREMAKFQADQSKDAIGEALAKAEIGSAEEMSKKLGGALGVKTILALNNAVENNKNPFEIGVPPEDVQLWLKARELTSGAYVREQILNNNPTAMLLEQMGKNMKEFGGNLDQLGAMNNASAELMAQLLAAADLGDRPGADNPEGQAFWDQRAKYHYNTLGIIGKRSDSFIFDWMNPDEVDVTQQAPFARGATADTTGASKGTPAATNRGVPKMPTFQDPAAAGAVTGAVRWLNDPSLFTRTPRGNAVPGR